MSLIFRTAFCVFTAALLGCTSDADDTQETGDEPEPTTWVSFSVHAEGWGGVSGTYSSLEKLNQHQSSRSRLSQGEHTL